MAVAAAAMVFMLWLAKTGPGDDADVYDIVFQEAVTGLAIDSRVLYSGIHVGAVESIRIDPDDPRRVIARIRVDGQTPVKQDTQAQLILINVTGTAEILLSGGSPASPPLAGEDGGVPKIVAEPSRIARLTEAATKLVDEIGTLVEGVGNLLSGENAAHLARTMENFDAFSSSLAGQGETLERVLGTLARVSEDAERLMQRANTMLEERGEAMMSDATEAMESLKDAAGQLDRLLHENEDALAGGIQGLNELGPALDELRRTLATLSDVARRFDQDPGGYLFGREPVREFKP